MKNRIGKVEISEQFIKNFVGVFAEMNPLEISKDANGIWTYTCLSEKFRELNEGEKIPFYHVDAIDASTKEEEDYIFVIRGGV